MLTTSSPPSSSPFQISILSASALASQFEAWKNLEEVKRSIESMLSDSLRMVSSVSAVERTLGLKRLSGFLSGMDEATSVMFCAIEDVDSCRVMRAAMMALRALKAGSIRGITNADEALQTFQLVQGLVLVHSKSKEIASSGDAIDCILTWLQNTIQASSFSATLQTIKSALDALQSLLVESCRALRAFEAADGLDVTVKLITSRSSPADIKHKVLELLFVYLHPESSYPDSRPDEPHGVPSSVDMKSKQERLAAQLNGEFVNKLLISLRVNGRTLHELSCD
ncbi:hypothetical protein SeLEV6574_g05071 [Synchytrium endobioticum]|nr:hypothetical protein SeLEV6574_g05071 [Synchytrium endobioticum]